MGREDWDVPRTEAGLQQVLLRLETCRSEGPDTEIGNGLLALSFLVKWVRSDTDKPPFERSHELALEALDAFRRAQNAEGQVRALVASSALADRELTERNLAEAEGLAAAVGDDDLVASVIAARARKLAISDRNQAHEMHRRALEIYERTGNRKGQALCHFSLAIGRGTREEQRVHALRGAELYRQLDNHGEAARCVILGLMHVEKPEELCEFEDLVKQGLDDAQRAENRSLEGIFYKKLALIEASKGRFDEAGKYQRWASELQDADGLTPLERWEQNVAMTKEMISVCEANKNKTAAQDFRDELKRLKAEKPKA